MLITLEIEEEEEAKHIIPENNIILNIEISKTKLLKQKDRGGSETVCVD